MIQIKHFLEAPDLQDGVRLWVEPLDLTRDLRLWCRVDDVMRSIAPPPAVWRWFQRHADGGYEQFRDRYHEELSRGECAALLRKIECLSRRGTVTLLHQGDHPHENTAAALRDFFAGISLIRH